MTPIQTLIVDHEENARAAVRGWLGDESDIELIGECSGGEEAVKALKAHAPDLVLLEAELPAMNGFDVLNAAALTPSPAVIFMTDCADYALKAFDVHATDYLLKPFTPRRFREALQWARAQIRSESLSSLIDPTNEQSDSKATSHAQRLAVKERDHTAFLDVADIDWIEAADNYVRLHTEEQTTLLRTTMNELQDKLDPARFARVHRSHIVNVDRVKEAYPRGSGDYTLVLDDGTRLKSSRTYSDQRRRVLNIPA